MKFCAHLADNFGDSPLTEYLIEKISGEKAEYSEDTDLTRYVVTGSILGMFETRLCDVWGAGIASADQRVPREFAYIFYAVRGPRTLEAVRKAGYEGDVAIGDPGLLLPKFFEFPVDEDKKLDLTIICSWVDFDAAYRLGISLPQTVTVLCSETLSRMMGHKGLVENYLRMLLCSKATISSTLHGLVASVAYGIPTKWVKFSDKMMGDDTKYHDFFESIGCLAVPKTENLEECGTIDDPPFVYDIPDGMLDKLWDACPFRRDR